MNLQLFKKIGKCDNCKEDNVPLEEVEIKGRKKEFCDTCVEGLKMENEK